ncbi:hypothetical protein D3C73_1150000 [compost metagenome]
MAEAPVGQCAADAHLAVVVHGDAEARNACRQCEDNRVVPACNHNLGLHRQRRGLLCGQLAADHHVLRGHPPPNVLVGFDVDVRLARVGHVGNHHNVQIAGVGDSVQHLSDALVESVPVHGAGTGRESGYQKRSIRSRLVSDLVQFKGGRQGMVHLKEARVVERQARGHARIPHQVPGGLLADAGERR